MPRYAKALLPAIHGKMVFADLVFPECLERWSPWRAHPSVWSGRAYGLGARKSFGPGYVTPVPLVSGHDILPSGLFPMASMFSERATSLLTERILV